jgi:hypothetical protein
MDTKKWGKASWDVFFIYSRNYPEIIDEKNKEHSNIRKATYQFYESLIYILPCIYCRISYKGFWKELPIKDYLQSREKLTEWLYLMKDKVNQKLSKQEKDRYKKEVSKLKNPSKEEKDELKRCILYTKPSPPLEEVVKKYEKYRAVCGDNKCVSNPKGKEKVSQSTK